jgi:serine/threonine protein phosphatase PrpC
MKEKIETLRQTTFIMAAKSNVGMVRDNNEDNFQVSSSLDREPMSWMNNELCELSPRGALLVVADGMGGMNAGEVASEIAIETLKDIFTPQNITDEVIKNRYTVERFMNSVITEADNRIKQTAKENPATKGMGTTMVMGWVLENSLYVSWAGDSRAYVFNPLKGLKRLSKDHSLVQELVDSGKISKEDAFDYPDSNVITNCLSAVSQKAVPEAMAMPHKLEEGDIILLCSDGLCGLIRDTDIQGVISQNQYDMTACCDALIKAACDAGGHDNVTVALCKIVTLKDGGADEDDEVEENFGRKTWIRWGGITLAVLAVAFCVWWFWLDDNDNSTENEVPSTVSDKTSTEPSSADNNLPPKVWSYYYKSGNNNDSTDDVSARLTAKQTLIIKTDRVEYQFQKFVEQADELGFLIGEYTFNKKNHRIKFCANDFFYDHQINGYFTIDGSNDTVKLTNVPLEIEEKQTSSESLSNGHSSASGSGGLFNGKGSVGTINDNSTTDNQSPKDGSKGKEKLELSEPKTEIK